jgi:phospholipase/lecithinase/hemolysin
MKHLRTGLTVVAAAALLVACGGGGGGSDTTPRAHITSVKVFGDSLADVGTFGFKFTVQGAASLIYPERVAQAYGVTLCPFLKTSDGGQTFTPNTTAGCTGYAVGGGRINFPTAPTSPYSIQQQLATVASLGSYSATDLLVIDGGGNDAADLVSAYLKATSDNGASFVALVSTIVPAAVVNATLNGPNPLETLGGIYMTTLADTFFASIKTNALDKGATNVVLLNMPSVTNTPRFQMVLDAIAAAAGGGTTGATARAQAEGLFKTWFQAFNAELANKVAGNSSIVLTDFYTSFNNEITSPAQYGLQNVTTPACPITGVGSDGLPTYTFPTCTDAALSAMTPPAGATGGADWWKTFAFSDSFHPTPYGHQLIYQRISLDLASSGRL